MADARRLVRRGDKTTTGGEVLEGCGHVILDYMDVANRGMKASCGACGQVGIIQDCFPHNLETEFGSSAVDGDEVLCGCPKGSNRVIAGASAPAIVGRGGPLSFRFASSPVSSAPEACIFAKSCTVPLTSIDAGMGLEPVSNFGRAVVLGPISAAEKEDNVAPAGAMQSAGSVVALGRLSGSVPSGLGSWGLRAVGGATGAFVMAFWPSDMADGTLYSDEQLRNMSRAATRVRFRFAEDEDGQLQVYGIHTSAESGMESVPVVQARQEGSALVASVPDGPTLTWYPDSNGEIADASSYYPEQNGMDIQNIWVRPISDAPESEIGTYPIADRDLQDCIITFPVATGLPPLYLVFSKPPVKLLEVDTFRNFDRRPRNGTHADHMPSQAAIEEYLKSLDPDMDQGLIKSLKKDVASIIIPASVHRKHSETYGGRNNRDGRLKVINDSKDLRRAVDSNFNAIKPYLLDEGFSDFELEQARERMHEINIKYGWYQ